MPTNPYSSQAISGYNATPPADDGSQVSSNQLEWDKHKTKLGDPVKTLSEAINTELLAQGAKLINTDSEEDNAIAGSLAFTAVNATVTDGVISPLVSSIFLDTEGAAASDELTHIATTTATNNPQDGAILFLAPFATGHVVTLKHEATTTATGSLHMRGRRDVALDEKLDVVLLHKRGEDWYELTSAPALADRGHIDGLILGNTSTDTANDVDVGPGEITLVNSDDERLTFDFPSTIVKRLDATWATGSSAGGLPSTVTYAATTTYHVFALGDTSSGVDAGLDTSVSATGLLATATGFPFFRRIGSVITTTGTELVQFSQHGDDVLLATATGTFAISPMAASATTQVIHTPEGIKLDAQLLLGLARLSSATIDDIRVLAFDPDVNSATSAATTDNFTVRMVATGNLSAAEQVITHVRTDTSSRIGYVGEATDGAVTFRGILMGWRDERGRNATS